MSARHSGDVVLVPFPFTDQTVTKQRPAVVISSHALNLQRPDIIVMAVTSQLKPSVLIGEVEITEWQKAGLLKPSVVKPVIATLENIWCVSSWGNCKRKTWFHFERFWPSSWDRTSQTTLKSAVSVADERKGRSKSGGLFEINV